LRTVKPTVPSPSTLPPPPAARPSLHPVRRIGPELHLAAACRLVSQTGSDVEHAARRLVSAAPEHEIDLSMVWATLDAPPADALPPKLPRVRQACLAVYGAGRTVMLFLSEPAPGGDFGDPAQALRERVEVVGAACAALALDPARARIAQALPDPADVWAIDAYAAAGFLKVGDLTYLRREPSLADRAPRLKPSPDTAPWPKGVTVTRLDRLPMGTADGLLAQALERTYEDTLDCPELCGLRDTADVLDSHRSTGVFDPALWWLLHLDGLPHGCCLLNRCPEGRTVELVYLGLSPPARGRGLGKRLLTNAMTKAREVNPGWSVTCAVDARNAPALALYASLGFRPFGGRIALVRPLGG